MTLTLNKSLSSTITKSELETNFTDIENKFGAIDNSDIKAGAGIAISKLEASKEYVVVVLETRGDGTGWTVDDQYRDYVSLPGITSTQSVWTLKAASWVCTDVGDGSPETTFDVEWQHWTTATGAGGTASVTTLIAGETLDKGSGGLLNAGQCVVDHTSTFAFHSANTGVLALKVTHANSATLNPADAPAAPIFLKVSLLLERDLQA